MLVGDNSWAKTRFVVVCATLYGLAVIASHVEAIGGLDWPTVTASIQTNKPP